MNRLNINNIVNKVRKERLAEERCLHFLSSYYGINSKKSKTLQEVGEEFGLTKEGVRQALSRLKRDISSSIKEHSEIYSLIKDLRDLVKHKLPSSEKRLKEYLYAEGVINHQDDSIAWLIPLTNLYGSQDHFYKEKINNHLFYSLKGYVISKNISSYAKNKVIALECIGDFGRVKVNSITKVELLHLLDKGWVSPALPAKWVRSYIIKNIVSNGAVNLSDFVESTWNIIENKSNMHNVSKEIKKNFVYDVATAMSDFQCLGEEWFWLKEVGRNRLKTNIYKVLSVKEFVDLDDMSERILHATDIPKMPPPSCIAIMFEDDAHIIVNKEDESIIFQNVNLTPEEHLSSTELKMYKIIKDIDEIHHKEFAELSFKVGISNYQFCMRLNYSPIFFKKDRGVYTI